MAAKPNEGAPAQAGAPIYFPMKLPPIPWFVVLFAALICAVFAVAYAHFGLPTWIVLFSGLSFCVLLALALSMRDSRVLESNYEYGRCNDRLARRHKSTLEVQFILWKAGQQGHAENYWHRFDPSWWPSFVSGKAQREPEVQPAASAES